MLTCRNFQATKPEKICAAGWIHVLCDYLPTSLHIPPVITQPLKNSGYLNLSQMDVNLLLHHGSEGPAIFIYFLPRVLLGAAFSYIASQEPVHS